MISNIIIDVISLQGFVESRIWAVLNKLQNAVIAGPGQKGMRDQITWFVLNALSCIYFIDTDCFWGAFQPEDQVGSNTWITLKSYISSAFIQSHNWTGQQGTTINHKWQV